MGNNGSFMEKVYVYLPVLMCHSKMDYGDRATMRYIRLSYFFEQAAVLAFTAYFVFAVRRKQDHRKILVPDISQGQALMNNVPNAQEVMYRRTTVFQREMTEVFQQLQQLFVAFMLTILAHFVLGFRPVLLLQIFSTPYHFTENRLLRKHVLGLEPGYRVWGERFDGEVEADRIKDDPGEGGGAEVTKAVAVAPEGDGGGVAVAGEVAVSAVVPVVAAKEAEVKEADLVSQAKLIRSEDQRVPRLQDLTMRPRLAGKTVGALEAHSNGLRFASKKHAPLDILYANIKHAFYQPCNGVIDTKVVLHFSLKHPIMVGKKAHKEIQVSIEAIDATTNLDGAKRSNCDPDETVEEQRESQLRERLNNAFKGFASEVTKAARIDGQHLEFDIPFDQLGFQGKPFKKMVFIQPTTHALVNITDLPFFVVPLNEIEHVHFERVSSSSKTCDLKIIRKDNMLENGGEPRKIDMIDQIKFWNKITAWLEERDITYTQTAKRWAWKPMMADIRSDSRFYLDTYEDGRKKPAGWARLRKDGSEDEDEEGDGESDFEIESESSEDDSDGSDSDDSEDEDDGDDDDSDKEETGETAAGGKGEDSLPMPRDLEDALIDAWEAAGSADWKKVENELGPFSVNTQTPAGSWTPLMVACGLHKVTDDEIQGLISDLDARVDLVDDDGWTCLHWAAQQGRAEAVRAVFDGIGDVASEATAAAATVAGLLAMAGKDGRTAADVARGAGLEDGKLEAFLEALEGVRHFVARNFLHVDDIVELIGGGGLDIHAWP